MMASQWLAAVLLAALFAWGATDLALTYRREHRARRRTDDCWEGWAAFMEQEEAEEHEQLRSKL